MLAFSTGKKKKRNWRELADDDTDTKNAKVEAEDDVIDEKELEAALAEQEKEENAEQQRLENIKEEAEVRKALRQQRWAEAQAKEEAEKKAKTGIIKSVCIAAAPTGSIASACVSAGIPSQILGMPIERLLPAITCRQAHLLSCSQPGECCRPPDLNRVRHVSV